jgi:hypothetical protein
MSNILIFGITTIIIGGLFAIPGIILGYELEKSHKAPNRGWLSLIFCMVLVFIKRIWFPDLSYYLLAIILILGSTLGVYRMDIYWAINRAKKQN